VDMVGDNENWHCGQAEGKNMIWTRSGLTGVLCGVKEWEFNRELAMDRKVWGSGAWISMNISVALSDPFFIYTCAGSGSGSLGL